MLYAFTNVGNSSALVGLSANTSFYNTLLGLVMLFGRYLPMVFVIALAGSLADSAPPPPAPCPPTARSSRASYSPSYSSSPD